jgi:hypothetical protein
MWSLARDDRPWGGHDPPAVAYTYAPGRGGTHAVKLLAGFNGILQVDALFGLQATDPADTQGRGGDARLLFYEVYVGGHAPIATEALARIKLLYAIEADIRGLPTELRRAVHQEKSKPVIEAFKPWFEESLAQRYSKGGNGEAIRYGLNQASS